MERGRREEGGRKGGEEWSERGREGGKARGGGRGREREGKRAGGRDIWRYQHTCSNRLYTKRLHNYIQIQ